MKALKIILQILKWILIVLILLFALATFIAGSYANTAALLVAAAALAYWPGYLEKKLGKLASMAGRVSLIILALILNFTVFSSGPKQSIYTSEEIRPELLRIYDEKMKDWPEDTRDLYLETEYGTVHILICGAPENPPLVMLHAASMGAHSWSENLAPLLDSFRIYAFDNIGEGNKSELNNALEFPQAGKELADFYARLLDTLQIEGAPVFGASNGGYIAQILAFYHPEKVQSLALFGPMGLTKLTPSSIFMLSVGSMYPFRFIRKRVSRWGISDDDYCQQKYGDWFDCIVRGTMPSVARPVPMTPEQKKSMDLPVILFLGTEDGIVGDAKTAKEAALDYPDIQIEILESGHLIAVEEREFVNEKIAEFLDLK